MIFKIFDKLESGILGMMRTNVKMKKKNEKYLAIQRASIVSTQTVIKFLNMHFSIQLFSINFGSNVQVNQNINYIPW